MGGVPVVPVATTKKQKQSESVSEALLTMTVNLTKLHVIIITTVVYEMRSEFNNVCRYYIDV